MLVLGAGRSHAQESTTADVNANFEPGISVTCTALDFGDIVVDLSSSNTDGLDLQIFNVNAADDFEFAQSGPPAGVVVNGASPATCTASGPQGTAYFARANPNGTDISLTADNSGTLTPTLLNVGLDVYSGGSVHDETGNTGISSTGGTAEFFVAGKIKAGINVDEFTTNHVDSYSGTITVEVSDQPFGAP